MPSSPAPNGSKPTKVGLWDLIPIPSHTIQPWPPKKTRACSFKVWIFIFRSFTKKKQKKTGGKSPSRPRNSQQNVPPKTEEKSVKSSGVEKKLVKSAGVKSMYIILCTVMPLETLICRLSHEVSLTWIMMDFSKTNPQTLSAQKYSPKHRCLGFLMLLWNVGCFKIGDPKENLLNRWNFLPNSMGEPVLVRGRVVSHSSSDFHKHRA